MLDREPFLRAIFAEPYADLPRLVFADYLEERGEESWARAIRTGVEAGGERGFPRCKTVELAADELLHPDALRLRSVSTEPHWFGAKGLKVIAGQILTPEPLRTILTLPAFESIVELNLSGSVAEIPVELSNDGEQSPMLLYDMETRPVITVRMVEALAEMRECRRLISLDLRHNELDNDAVRAIAESRNFIRIRHLFLGDGNRFKGRTWARVYERFGQDVVQ